MRCPGAKKPGGAGLGCQALMRAVRWSGREVAQHARDDLGGAAQVLQHQALVGALGVGFQHGARAGAVDHAGNAARSEEHTSELQSQSNLVCRLLLEKKKKTTLQLETTLRRGPETESQPVATVPFRLTMSPPTTIPPRRQSADEHL